VRCRHSSAETHARWHPRPQHCSRRNSSEVQSTRRSRERSPTPHGGGVPLFGGLGELVHQHREVLHAWAVQASLPKTAQRHQLRVALVADRAPATRPAARRPAARAHSSRRRRCVLRRWAARAHCPQPGGARAAGTLERGRGAGSRAQAGPQPMPSSPSRLCAPPSSRLRSIPTV
jgi:hypothetical protein